MRSTFFCIDGHTAGNPVRLVVGGTPLLRGATMSERRQHFIEEFDWILKGLMFEPRGHDMMSGGFILPPLSPDADAAILFIETSGALPMCGHGSIGMITFGLEHGLIRPRTEGRLTVEVPAGTLDVRYERDGAKVKWVRLTNVPSFLHTRDVTIEDSELGPLRCDIAYGGNFYAIIEPQGAFTGIDALGADAIIRHSPRIREAINRALEVAHPLDPSIRGVSHVMWAEPPHGGTARSGVFYGVKAIDRSPCGTGTSARLAQLVARGIVSPDGTLTHQSYIRSTFEARVEGQTQVGPFAAIRPSIQGSAYATGYNQIWIDDAEPFPEGFSVT